MKALVCVLMLFSTSALLADDFDATREKIEAAMQSDIRTEADTDRDRNRKPVETLEFFGLRDDMKVIELVPGGGWYTKILAPVLAENGEYYAALGTSRIRENIVGQPGFENLKLSFVCQFVIFVDNSFADRNVPLLNSTILSFIIEIVIALLLNPP